MQATAPAPPSGRSAGLVGAGILLSRLFGLLRQRALSHYLGLSDAADAFNAAFRIPNLLQNLFGEGVLSASFIPVYARLRAQGEEGEAVRVANAVFGLLGLITACLVALGVTLAAPLTDVIAPGFAGAKRDLTVLLVRILFPGAGLLVFAAWCLGVLNSHRRFFLSYAAPVVWNLAIIGALLWHGPRADAADTVLAAAWGAVAGSALQFGVQLPTVIRLLGRFGPRLEVQSAPVRQVLKHFGPVFVGRGVVQISAFVDTIIASLLPGGAVAGLASAQMLYTLPVSLFGMSVSAAELPEMAGAAARPGDAGTALRARLDQGLRRIAFFVIPSAAAFLGLGAVIAGALFQTGRFSASDSRYVWGILAGSAVGLLAATLGRLYSSAYYALQDTATPLRFALARVSVGSALGYLAATRLPGLLGLEARWGAAGITAAAGLAAWMEFTLLRRGLERRIGPTGVPARLFLRLWAAALVGLGAGLGVDHLPWHLAPVARAAAVLIPFGLVYLAITAWLGVPEARALAGQVGRWLGPRRGRA